MAAAATSLGDEMRVRFGIAESSYSARINWCAPPPPSSSFGASPSSVVAVAAINWSDFMVLLMESEDDDEVEKYVVGFTEPMRYNNHTPGLGHGNDVREITFKDCVLQVRGRGHFSFQQAPFDRTDLLHVAASTGMQRAAFAFLAHGADPNRVDHLLRTPLQVAKTPEMRALLISAGAKPIEQPTAAPAARAAPTASAENDLPDESMRKLAAMQARLAVMAASNARLRGADAALRASNASLSDTIAHMAGVKRKAGDEDAAPDANEGADKRRVAKRWKAELIGLSQMGFIDFARNVALLEKHVGAGGIAAVLEELLSS